MSEGDDTGRPERKRSTPRGWPAQAGRLTELRLRLGYHFLRALQAPFGAVFWVIEQRKGRIADRLANRGVDV
jgi:hypothetical protein